MGGGGKILRAIGTRVGGIKSPIPSSSSSTPFGTPRLVSLPSSCPPPTPITSGWQNLTTQLLCKEEEEEEEEGFWSAERVVFGPAPSREEAVEAVSAIQQVFIPFTFSQIFEEGSSNLDKEPLDKASNPSMEMHDGLNVEQEVDWIEPPVQLYNTSTIPSHNVIDAFRSLQTSPSIQKMVVSLSSDKAVWDAVMKNDAVKELKESFFTAERNRSIEILKPDNDPPDIPRRILRWILENTRAKLMELFDNITKLVNELFHSPEKGKKMGVFEDAVRSSFMLSVVVFIVVVMFRVHRA